MARYCEAKDLRALVPDTFRDAALADTNGGNEADAGLLKAVLDGACDEVDALIEGRVRLPLATTPAKLRVAAANIALELLFIRRGRELPGPAAEKVQWWRAWLSKVGEGELRLDAPDTAGKTEYPGAVATRPAVTGSGRLLFALAVSFGMFALGRVESLAVEARSWAFDLPAAEDVFENPEEMEWSQGESLVLEYAGGTLEEGQVARWEVAGGTNLWVDKGNAGGGTPWRWELSPEESALPAGRYSGRVAVYEVAGGTTTFHRVAALQGIRVHRGNEGLAEVAPLVVRLEDYALREWVEGELADLATAGYVVKTNGEWVIVQGTEWTGIEWGGERVFGAVLEVHDTGLAEITGLGVLATNVLEVTFWGATTNRLEAREWAEEDGEWTTWNECGWVQPAEGGGTGSVAVSNASPSCWYRVAAAGTVPAWSNTAVVSYAPLYAGSVADSNRVATLGDLQEVGPPSHGPSMPPIQYEDAMHPNPTNLAWRFNFQDGAYIRHLQIGGQTFEIEVSDGGTTNTVTVTNGGSLTLGGVTWTKFPDIGGQVYEDVEEIAPGVYVTNSWTNPGTLELDGVEINNWGELTNGVVAKWRLLELLEGATNAPAATNLNSAMVRANTLWDVLTAAAGVAEPSPAVPATAGISGGTEEALAIGQWIMHEAGGVLVNGGSAGVAGDLRRTEGAALSEDVPEANVDGNDAPWGKSLRLSSTLSGTAAAESMEGWDPLAGAKAFFIAAWVRRTGETDTAARIASDISSKGGGSGVEFRFSGDAGNLALKINGSNILTAPAGHGIPPGDSEWHHVAVGFDGTVSSGGTVYFYVDGIQRGDGSGAALRGTAVGDNSVPFTVGNSSAGRVALSQFVGEIDDVQVFRDFAPEPVGNGARSGWVAALMDRSDIELVPERDPSAPVALGEMDPETLLYSAPQIDEMLSWTALDLHAECAGGWAYPDYFTVRGVEAGAVVATNVSFGAAEAVHNIRQSSGTTTTYRGWSIQKEIVRSTGFTNRVEWADGPDAPEAVSLVYEGDTVRFSSDTDFGDLDGHDDEEMAEMVNRAIEGTLGEYTASAWLEWDGAKQRGQTTVWRFEGPNPGSFMAATWSNVLVAASNGHAAGKTIALRTWPDGYGGASQHVPAGWNTNFWGYGLGDFSCISYHAAGCGVYRPMTMITPKHAVCANHWKPAVGADVYWVTRSGAVATNRVAEYLNIRGDLTLARLEHGFDTNDVAPAKLLAPCWHPFFYGSTNRPVGLSGFAVLSFDCAERGHPQLWHPTALELGQAGGGKDDRSGTWSPSGVNSPPYAGPYAWMPVGGDSGSPTFLCVDGQTVLLWCWHTALGGPIPAWDEVQTAIDAWGDPEQAETYHPGEYGWDNPDGPPAM